MEKINKDEFLNLIQDGTKLSRDECLIINDILEGNFLLGNKNKPKIINGLIDKLNIDKDKAEEIYNITNDIILSAIKERLRHPFRTQD